MVDRTNPADQVLEYSMHLWDIFSRSDSLVTNRSSPRSIAGYYGDAFPAMLWSNFIYTAVYSLPEQDATDASEHAPILQVLEKHHADQAE